MENVACQSARRSCSGLVERVDEEGTVERELELARWGLKPFFMKDSPKPGFHNARLETVADKPSFRTAFTKRRALVR
jgi:putative SOS response-associated peptidase YedK